MDLSSSAFMLYARPSFWEGMARIVDLGGILNEYNGSSNGELADIRALRADWMAVGNDIQAAIVKYAEEHPWSN